MMENKNNMEKISIRRCDLNAVLSMISLGNQGVIKEAWNAIEVYIKG